MSTPKSIGAIELSSIGIGYQIEDEMLKAASVELLIARTICSGKYLIVLGGSVSDVEAAIRAGLGAASDSIIDHLIIPNVHPSVFPALGQSVALAPEELGALGVVETFSGVSVIAAADAAAKAARITLFRIHVAMALGGKGLCLMTGTVADVRAGVQVAAAEARKRGLLVAEIVIPRPSRELFGDYL
jgi:microcompartment protein CcmL/EutN